jgi:hypothetical protein
MATLSTGRMLFHGRVASMSITSVSSSERAAINRANSQFSTGPRTEAGKERSSFNALRHGLTAANPVLPSENPAAYEAHRSGFFDEYKPATPTEAQLVQELVDTSWRLNRIPALEAGALAHAIDLPPDICLDATGELDILGDAHRALAVLGLHSGRLSRQFQRALAQLREIQKDRAESERRDLKDAAALLELHKHKGIPWQPSDHGFVFSLDKVERFAGRATSLKESQRIEQNRSNPRGSALIGG